MKILFKFLVIFLFFTLNTFAEKISIFNFTEEEFVNLEVRKVRGADAQTDYSIGSNENGNFLKAEANNAASGLGKQIKIDLNKTPYLNIKWKVEKDLKGIDESTKKGHDYQRGYLL